MKKWTIIIQMSAESDLIYNNASAFDEIGSVGSNADVNYIVLFDGMETPRYPKAPIHPCIYCVEAGTKYEDAIPFHNFGEEYDHLADTRILTKILSFIKEKFPAEQYGYMYKGHGGAGGTDIAEGKYYNYKLMELPDGTYEEVEAKLIAYGGDENVYEGYCEQENGGKIILAIYSNKEEGSYLTYAGMAKVLNQVFPNRELAFVCLDCCWGQQIEHAYTFRNTTNYFVASVDEMPTLGLGYKQLCEYLNHRPKIKPYELANMLVAVYFVKNYADYDSPIEYFRQMGVSLTCVNTIRLNEHMVLFNRICQRLLDKMDNHHESITKALACCKDYTYELARGDYAVYNLDLIWLLENIMHFNTTDQTLDKYILDFIRHHLLYYIRAYLGNNYKETTPGQQDLGGKGVSIAFPRNKDELETSIYFGDGKPDFVKDSLWKKMLLSYYNTSGKQVKTKRKKPTMRSLTPMDLDHLELTAVNIEPSISHKWGKFHPAAGK